MSLGRRTSGTLMSLLLLSSLCFFGQEDVGWRISPERINIQLGEDRALQILDDSAQERSGAVWSVDNPDRAELLKDEDGRMVLHPKALGTVVVTATLGQETRTREIKIWSALRPVPEGVTNWGLHPIGREIGDLPAVPTIGGASIYSLEQTTDGKTYLRADRIDGIQVWTWLLPENVHDVELICGDWSGGALIGANRPDSFTLYTVAKDGTLSWQHTFPGVRKSLAYNLQHLIHVESQSVDGNVTSLTGLDEMTGAVKFDFTVPSSHENLKNIRRAGTTFLCATGSDSRPLRTAMSRVIVNMDGYAYLALTHDEWTLDGGKCPPGAALDAHSVSLTGQEQLLLWQIHPDGTYRSIVVEATKVKQSLFDPMAVVAPTGALVTDNMNGTLIPVRLSRTVLTNGTSEAQDEFVYRVNQDGELVYKFPLPRYAGPLRDDMVIGTDNTGFATRGGQLIAFNLVDGKELWRWDSNTDDISVLAALVHGACAVQTPTDVVIVEKEGARAKVVLRGKGMIGWNGQLYRKHT